MANIVISGYYGFGNAGDEAMLAAILESILEIAPDSRITVISGNPKLTETKHGVKAVGRFDMARILSAIAHCDLLISGGGSLLQDVTSNRSLYYYLSIIRLATWLGKKVMLYAQGIGPLRKQRAQQTVANVLNKVTMITVRDEKSKLELERLGVNQVPITVTADAVLAMHPVDTMIGERLLQPYNLGGTKRRIGVSVRTWKQDTSYRQELANALDALHEKWDADIVFIPMQHPEDTKEAMDIQSLMKTKAIVLSSVYTTTELLALAGCVDVMIGVRLHALVFGSLMEKPVVGISYDPKIDNFLHMIGQEPIGNLKDLKAEEVVRHVSRYLEQGCMDYTSLQMISALKESSLQNTLIAFSLLDKA